MKEADPNGALDTRLLVETPEHVVFPYRVAGPGPRAVAWLLDAAFRAGILLFLAILVMIVGGTAGLTGLSTGLVLVLWFLFDWGWYTVLDAMTEGRSPGRAVMGLRVIREDGGPIGWKEAVLRNLVRPADAMPLGYVVGVTVSTLDPKFRRLGDLLAGTVVVHVQDAVVPPAARPLPSPDERERLLLPPRLRIGVALRSALERWHNARERLGPAWAAVVAGRVIEGIRGQYRILHRDPVRSLELLLFAARENQGSHQDAAPWKDLRRQLHEGGRMDATQLQRLVWGYRSLCADLGRRRPVLAPEHLAPLEALCAKAHARIYRTPVRLTLPPLRLLARVLLHDFPAELRRNGSFFLAAAALFILPGLLGFFMGLGDSSFVDAVIPGGMRGHIEKSYSEAPSRDAGENAMMAGFYVWNNVGIALRSIGAGFFACLGTALVLIYNGLVIGTVFGFLASVGYGGNLLRFTSGHSAWELTALVIAGAAGLKLGWTVMVPGPMSRLAALRQAGPAIGRLAGGAAVMLVVAAGIEGFWSAQDLPDWARAAFAAVQVLLVGGYLSGFGRGAWTR